MLSHAHFWAACMSRGAELNNAPDAVIAAIELQHITDTSMVPTMLQSLLDEAGFTPQRVQSLNRIAFGAAPMPPALLDRALAAWPQAEFFQAHGLTETAGAVLKNELREQALSSSSPAGVQA